MSPQSATPASISDHSEGFNPNSLPSLITYAIICMYSVLTRCTVAIVGGGGCSAQVTDRMNVVPKDGSMTPTRGHTSGVGKADTRLIIRSLRRQASNAAERLNG